MSYKDREREAYLARIREFDAAMASGKDIDKKFSTFEKKKFMDAMNYFRRELGREVTPREVVDYNPPKPGIVSRSKSAIDQWNKYTEENTRTLTYPEKSGRDSVIQEFAMPRQTTNAEVQPNIPSTSIPPAQIQTPATGGYVDVRAQAQLARERAAAIRGEGGDFRTLLNVPDQRQIFPQQPVAQPQPLVPVRQTPQTQAQPNILGVLPGGKSVERFNTPVEPDRMGWWTKPGATEAANRDTASRMKSEGRYIDPSNDPELGMKAMDEWALANPDIAKELFANYRTKLQLDSSSKDKKYEIDAQAKIAKFRIEAEKQIAAATAKTAASGQKASLVEKFTELASMAARAGDLEHSRALEAAAKANEALIDGDAKVASDAIKPYVISAYEAYKAKAEEAGKTVIPSPDLNDTLTLLLSSENGITMLNKRMAAGDNLWEFLVKLQQVRARSRGLNLPPTELPQ